MKKLLVIYILVIFILFTGCSNHSVEPEVEKDKEDTFQTEQANNHDNLLKDSGVYIGQIDSNFIEIKISGVPEEKSSKVFKLGDKIKNNFEKYHLKTNDEVRFEYYKNKKGHNVILKIEKIKT